MTTAELAKHNGQNGQPAYVAVSGTVYDVTGSSRWESGLHEGVHQAGQDLTEALKTAPHVRAVIERFPVVGSLADNAPQPTAAKRSALPIIIGGLLLLLIILVMLLK